jgi:hypothetical protein
MTKLFQQTLILFILGIALIAQITHSTYVFDYASNNTNTSSIIQDINIIKALTGWNITNGLVMAIAVELAIFLFVVFNLHRQSFVSMIASMIINLNYYAYHGHTYYSIIHLLESFILPYCIANFSQLLLLVGKTNINNLTIKEEFDLIASKLNKFNWEMFISLLPKFLFKSKADTIIDVTPVDLLDTTEPIILEDNPVVFDDAITDISNDVDLSSLSLREKIKYYLSLPDDKKPKNNDELAQLAQCSVPSVIKYKKELRDLNLNGTHAII